MPGADSEEEDDLYGDFEDIEAGLSNAGERLARQQPSQAAACALLVGPCCVVVPTEDRKRMLLTHGINTGIVSVISYANPVDCVAPSASPVVSVGNARGGGAQFAVCPCSLRGLTHAPSQIKSVPPWEGRHMTVCEQATPSRPRR